MPVPVTDVNDVTGNLWLDHSPALVDAYRQGEGGVRFELVTRALLARSSSCAWRVLDVGGGFGQQAVRLARAGHEVTVLDPDPAALELAEQRTAREAPEVRARVSFVQGSGADAVRLVGDGFDLACCHSVLMYLPAPQPTVRALVDAVAPGGLVSVLSVNPEALAMRSGLQQRWRDAVATLGTGVNHDSSALPIHAHSRQAVAAALEEAGARVLEWYGVGVFTDHLTEPVLVEDPELVYLAEWLAGCTDPYRQVARCYHLLAERTG